MTRLACALAVLLVACGGAAANGPDASLFAYDTSRPLSVRLTHRDAYGGVVRQYLTFDAGNGARLDAIYTYPDRAGSWPVVVFSPGYGGDESEQLPDASGLVDRGIASLTAGTPFPLITCNARKDIRAYASYVISRRRAIDLVASLPNADAARVAAVGFSFGAAITGTLVGVDHRLRAAVIQSGRGDHSNAIRGSCTQLGKRRLASYLSQLSVVDPINYIGRAAPTALLFQNGTQDAFSQRGPVNAYVRRASEPKEQHWYGSGHQLTPAATRYRDAWLARHLGAISATGARPASPRGATQHLDVWH